MRIVLIGIWHWHTPLYADSVLGMKGATIVEENRPRGRSQVRDKPG